MNHGVRRTFPILLTACTGGGDGDGDTNDQELSCNRELSDFCEPAECPTLAETMDVLRPRCDSSDGFAPDFVVLKRCGHGAAWSISTGDSYRFDVYHYDFDAAGALVAAAHTQDYEHACGGFTVHYGDPPACGQACIYEECGSSYEDEDPCPEGGAAPPGTP